MVAVAALLIAVLLLLEVWDLVRSGQAESDRPRLRFRGVVFLGVVVAVYGGLQAAGVWLLPRAESILESCRQLAGRWSTTAETPPPSPAITAVVSVLAFYIAGFWDYVVHRNFGHSRWFWFTHEYHHLPTRVTLLMPGILGRPFAAIPAALTVAATAGSLYAGLLLAGLPAWDLRWLLPVSLVIALVLVASHSRFLRRFPFIHELMRRAFLTTPHEHVLHHAADLDGNYGNFTTLWDRAFGTYINPNTVALDEVRLGLSYDQDFLGALTWGRIRIPSKWRGRLQLSLSCRLDDQTEFREQPPDQ